MLITLDTKPTIAILESFRDIMEVEYNENRHRGAFANYHIFEDSFKKGRAIVCLKDGKPIGVSIWIRFRKVVDIQYTWFLPSERNFYAAKRFMRLLAKEFKRRRDEALQTHCITLNGLYLACYSGFQIEDPEISFEDIREEFRYEKGSVNFRRSIDAIMYLR